MDYIHLAADQNTRPPRPRPFAAIEAGALFHAQSLELILGPAQGQAEQIAREWLARDGKTLASILDTCNYIGL